MADREPDPLAQRAWLTFAVVGAGPTGVELAGQIAELACGPLPDNYRHVDPTRARIVLLDAGSAVLASFPHSLQRRAVRDLERMGVEVHLGTIVTGVDARGIDTGSSDPALARIPAATKIWAAGVEASPLGRVLAAAAGAQVDRAGRVIVFEDCTLPGRPEIFVIGDLMSLDKLPRVAEVALQSRRHAAGTIKRRLAGDEVARPFHYRDLGSMATISRLSGDRRVRPRQSVGAVGMSVVASRAPDVPSLIQEPDRRGVGLGDRVHRARPTAAGNHRPTVFARASPGAGPGAIRTTSVRTTLPDRR